jgi:hypothetical protein
MKHYLNQQYMHVAPPLSVGTTYKPNDVQPRGVSMIMSSDSATAVPYGMVPQFSTLQIGSPVSDERKLFLHCVILVILFILLNSTSVHRIPIIHHQSYTRCKWAIRTKRAMLRRQMRLTQPNINMRQNKFLRSFFIKTLRKKNITFVLLFLTFFHHPPLRVYDNNKLRKKNFYISTPPISVERLQSKRN